MINRWGGERSGGPGGGEAVGDGKEQGKQETGIRGRHGGGGEQGGWLTEALQAPSEPPLLEYGRVSPQPGSRPDPPRPREPFLFCFWFWVTPGDAQGWLCTQDPSWRCPGDRAGWRGRQTACKAKALPAALPLGPKRTLPRSDPTSLRRVGTQTRLLFASLPGGRGSGGFQPGSWPHTGPAQAPSDPDHCAGGRPWLPQQLQAGAEAALRMRLLPEELREGQARAAATGSVFQPNQSASSSSCP